MIHLYERLKLNSESKIASPTAYEKTYRLLEKALKNGEIKTKFKPISYNDYCRILNEYEDNPIRSRQKLIDHYVIIPNTKIKFFKTVICSNMGYFYEFTVNYVGDGKEKWDELTHNYWFIFGRTKVDTGVETAYYRFIPDLKKVYEHVHFQQLMEDVYYFDKEEDFINYFNDKIEYPIK
jgi:hypothetical protein